MRELIGICAFKTILPSSYIITSSLTVDPEPFAAGGSGDVYRGTLDRSDVCVKRVRMYSKNGTDKPKKVCFRGHLSPCLHWLIKPVGLLQRGGDVETLEASKYSASAWSYH